MSVLPSAERTGTLEILELAASDVTTMFKFPAHAEWAKANAKSAARTVPNTQGRFDNFNRLPRGSEAFKRARLSMPLEDLFSRCFNPRAQNKNIRHWTVTRHVVGGDI